MGAATKQQQPVGVATKQQQQPVGMATMQQQPVGVATKQQEPVGVATVQQQPVGVATMQQQPVGVATKQQQPVGVATMQQQPVGVATENQPMETDVPQHEGVTMQHSQVRDVPQQPLSIQQPKGVAPNQPVVTKQQQQPMNATPRLLLHSELAQPVPLDVLIQHHLISPQDQCLSCTLMVAHVLLYISVYIQMLVTRRVVSLLVHWSMMAAFSVKMAASSPILHNG